MSKNSLTEEKESVYYVLVKNIWSALVNCIKSVKNVMENTTSVSVHLHLQNKTLLILPVKKIPLKQQPIIFPTKKLFYCKLLWPKQQAIISETTVSGNLQSEAFSLSDGENQRTNISNALWKKLNLPAIKPETILIKIFGKPYFFAQTDDIVVVKIKERNTQTISRSHLYVNYRTKICHLLSKLFPFEWTWKVDCFKNSIKKVDMFIISDYYYTFCYW